MFTQRKGLMKAVGVLLVILSLAIMGVGNACKAESSVEPAAEEASVEPAAEEPAAEEALEESAVVAADNYKIAGLVHGAAGHPWFEVVHKGAIDAAELFSDLDFDFIFVPPGKAEDPVAHLANFDSAAEAGYDAIIMSILDDYMFDEPIERAIENGIGVLGWDTDDSEGGLGNARMNSIGFDIVDLHYRAAIQEANTVGLKPGDHVVITNDSPGATWSEDSIVGHKKFCDEYGLEYDIINGSTEVTEGEAVISSYLSSHPETKSIMSASWMTGVGAAQALKALGYEPGEIGIIIRDPVEPALELMKEGYVTTDIALMAYLQGYYSVVAAYQYVKHGMPPANILLPAYILTGPEDVEKLEDLIEKGYL